MEKKDLSALDAKFEAQKIAFAPVLFQVTLSLRNLGVLEYLFKNRKGASISDMSRDLNISRYGLQVLLETGYTGGVVDQIDDETYTITKTGYFLLSDKMTKVNMDFTNDVCYKGLSHLEEAIVKGEPSGLKELGSWETIYEGLKDLDKKTQDSWFAFDHFYSDDSFPKALKTVFKDKPKHIIDVGGNTGKWAMACCNYDPDVKVTIVDLPGQIKMASENVRKAGFADRISFVPINMLRPDKLIPEGDVIWMSQFLDCFSENEIVAILKHASKSLGKNARVFIMETFWDNQKFPAASFSLAATSVYFTALANGNSKMYGRKIFLDLVAQAGLELEKEYSEIGISHTILKTKNPH